MPTGAPPSLQLDLFLRDTTAYQQALARYDRLRPILQGQATLTQQSHPTGIPYNQLWRDLRRFQRAGAHRRAVRGLREAWSESLLALPSPCPPSARGPARLPWALLGPQA